MGGILGKKVGMTQVFGEDGRIYPVTVVEAGPCLVVQRRTTKRDGYDAVQLGLVEKRGPRKVTKAAEGHFRSAKVPAMHRLMEFSVPVDSPTAAGDEINVGIFHVEQYVDVIGTGKGKGFQGVIKRHGFAGGRATHGSMFHRAPGSIGSSADPSRVFRGLRLPGRMGGKRITVKNLKIVRIDSKTNLIYLAGAVPGAVNSYVAIQHSRRG